MRVIFTRRVLWLAGLLLAVLFAATPSALGDADEARPIPAGGGAVGIAPLSSMAFPGIRPGAMMTSPNWCTLNYVYSLSGSLDGGPYFIGTARHCVTPQECINISGADLGGFDLDQTVIGQPVTAMISTSAGSLPTKIEIGRVRYATDGLSIGDDLALIEIYSSLEHLVSPSVAEIGGPTHVYTGTQRGQTAFLVGHGAGVGSGGSPRPAVLTAFSAERPSGFGLLGAASPGDSGSPVQTVTGGAVGTATHLGTSQSWMGANVFGTRVLLALEKWGLKVVTCPSQRPWPHTGCPS